MKLQICFIYFTKIQLLTAESGFVATDEMPGRYVTPRRGRRGAGGGALRAASSAASGRPAGAGRCSRAAGRLFRPAARGGAAARVVRTCAVASHGPVRAPARCISSINVGRRAALDFAFKTTRQRSQMRKRRTMGNGASCRRRC